MFGVAVLLPGLLFLVGSPKTIDPGVLPRFIVLTVGASGLLLLFIASLIRGESGARVQIAGGRAMALWLGYLVAVGASVLVAVNRAEAMFHWGRRLILFLLFTILAWLLSRDGGRVEALAAALSMLCLALALVGAAQLVRVSLTDGWSLENTYEVLGLSGARNLHSQALLLTLPFAVNGAVVGRRLWRAVSVLGAVLSVVLIVALMTRSVWIGAVAATVATAGLGVLRVRRRAEGWRPFKRCVGRLAAVLVLILAVGLLISGSRVRSALAARAGSILHIHEGTAAPRLFLWSRTAEMVGDHPLFGVGAANWRIVFPKYGGSHPLMQSVGRMPKRPHNDLLWILAETGTLGLTAYLALVLTLLWWTGRAVVEAQHRGAASLAAAVLFAQVAYLTVSFFSFPGERIEHSVLFVTVVAMGLALNHRIEPRSVAVGRSLAMAMVAVALVVTLAASVAGLVRMRGEIHMKRAFEHLQLAQLREAVREIDRAESPAYTVDGSGFPLCLYRAMALKELGEPERAHGDLLRAREESPYNVLVLHRLASSFARRGDQEEAARLWSSALDIRPGYPPALHGLASLTRQVRDQ